MELIDDLITEGAKYTFQNNSSQSGFSKASSELLTWVSRVEDYIRTNYDENSGPYKLIETVRKEKLSGYYQSEFESELAKLKGAINSCKTVPKNKVIKKDDHAIIALIKNPFFWPALVVFIGASYKFGYDNGNSKFDKEKIELAKENELFKSNNEKLEKTIKTKDSIIIEFKAKSK